MACALFRTCVFLLFVFYSTQSSIAHIDDYPELKIFGIEQFCATHSSHHVLKTSKLICLLCKGFDMSCLFKTTTAATTSSEATTTTTATTPPTFTTTTTTTTPPTSTTTTTTTTSPTSTTTTTTTTPAPTTTSKSMETTTNK